jgi:hypothetical protein
MQNLVKAFDKAGLKLEILKQPIRRGRGMDGIVQLDVGHVKRRRIPNQMSQHTPQIAAKTGNDEILEVQVDRLHRHARWNDVSAEAHLP